jgi:hypothetical protein
LKYFKFKITYCELFDNSDQSKTLWAKGESAEECLQRFYEANPTYECMEAEELLTIGEPEEITQFEFEESRK